jgi:hypothetical protein
VIPRVPRRRVATSLVTASIIASSMLAMVAGPVVAKKPIGSCPNGFAPDALDLDAVLAYKLALGFPPESVAPFTAFFGSVDKNGNGLVCLKDLPDTPGIAPWVTQLTDDVSNASTR